MLLSSYPGCYFSMIDPIILRKLSKRQKQNQ